jgi:cystathionine beta-synthase
LAQRLAREIPNGVILDQYRNVNNPLAHELTTGPEIIEAVTSTPSTPAHPSSGKVDVFAAGAGTGGTITGVSRAIQKTHNKDCIIVGIDPVGSILAYPDTLNQNSGSMYAIEGIGYDFIPDTLSRDSQHVSTWVKTCDDESFECTARLVRNEGLMVGGSSGSALAGTLKWLRESDQGKRISMTEGANVVVLLADSLRNYMGKQWFIDMAMGKPSPLHDLVQKTLGRSTKEATASATQHVSEPAVSFSARAKY